MPFINSPRMNDKFKYNFGQSKEIDKKIKINNAEK